MPPRPDARSRRRPPPVAGARDALAGRLTEVEVAHVPLVAGVVVTAVGTLVIGTWALGLDTFNRLRPGLPPTKANAGFALIALGAAIVLMRDPRRRSRARAGRALALTVAALGVAVVWEWVLGPLGIDELVFRDAGPSHGRMAPHTAVALLALGAMLALLDAPAAWRRTSDGLLALALVVVTSAFVGFAYNVAFLRGTSSATGMGLQAAFALAAATVGCAFLRPDRGPSAFLRRGDAGATMVRRMLPAVILVPLTLGVAYQETTRHGVPSATSLGIATLLGIAAFLAVIMTVALRLSEASVRLGQAARFFDVADDLFVTIDFEGRLQHLNGAWARTLGWTRDDLRGLTLEALIHADDLEVTGRDWEQARHGRSVTALRARYRTKRGGYRWLEANSVTVAEERLIYASARDITDRVRDEQARHEAEEAFTQAFEQAPTGVALMSFEGRLLRVNDAMCHLTGYPRAYLEATSSQAITHPDDVAEEELAHRRLVAGEAVAYRAEKRYVDALGASIPVELSVALIRDARGNPLHLLSQALDISERKRFEGTLQHLADHDSLTGLFNRRRFETELQRELASAARYGNRGAVLALDLDNFKYVNDSLGHAAGDELITRVGQALRRRLRATDVLARVGGDEFAIVLPRSERDAALLVADGVVGAVREHGYVGPGQRVSASVGVALFDGSQHVSAEELLVEADIAMYDAKEAGRDRVALFDAAHGRHERMHRRLTWADRIRDAIAEGRFVLHAQPIVGLDGDRGSRCELLIRMIGEDGELIPPATFLDVAERFNLISQIDRWVIAEAIAMLADEQHAGRDVHYAVNLSAKSITDSQTLELIARHLEVTGADARGLGLEITETAAIANIERAKAFSRSVRELGCEFALDDFGAGFASFYYLKHLEFDILKIDGEFIRDLPHNATNKLLVNAVVQIARGLGKRTVAEFIADAPTMAYCRLCGIDYAQGFHIAKPEPLVTTGARRPVPRSGR